MKPYYEHAGITIYHGDCRDVLPLLPSFDALITDPPYGIGLSSNGDHFSMRSVVNDEDQVVGQFAIDFARLRNLPIVAFADPLAPWPGKWSQCLVWDKGEAVGSGGDPKKCWRFDWEAIYVHKLPVLEGRRDSSVLHYPMRAFSPDFDYRFHPCAKSLDLMVYLLRKISCQLVCDPFLGGGTTLIAAKNLGRKAIGIEIKEEYCEIAAKRLSQEVFDFGQMSMPAKEEL